MIIDAEVHLVDPKIYKNLKQVENEKYFKEKILEREDGNYALRLSTVEKLEESMRENRIDKCLIMGLPFINDYLNDINNEYIKNILKNKKDFWGLGILNPLNKEQALKKIEIFKEEYGFIGVKLIPSWQNFKLDDENIFKIYELLIQKEMILFPHISYITAEHYQDSPQALFKLAKIFPELKILAPHLGGLLCFHYCYEPNKKFFKNIRFITSTPETMILVELASKVLDDEFLIFGSDYPFQPCHSQSYVLEKFLNLNIKDSLKEKILFKNFLYFVEESNV